MATKEEKSQQIKKLAEGLKESQAVVFADYSGLSVGEMSELRKKLEELSAEFKVVKNTLIKLAAERAQLPVEDLTGPTAVLLSRKGDPIESIKALVSLFKEAGEGAIKSGFFEGVLKDAPELSELALIPSRTELGGRLVGVLNSPLAGFVAVLRGNQHHLVSVLSEVAKLSEAKSASGGSKGGENR